jgi:hypothetical protein
MIKPNALRAYHVCSPVVIVLIYGSLSAAHDGLGEGREELSVIRVISALTSVVNGSNEVAHAAAAGRSLHRLQGSHHWVTHPMDQPLERTHAGRTSTWYPDLGTTSTFKSTPIDEPLLTI